MDRETAEKLTHGQAVYTVDPWPMGLDGLFMWDSDHSERVVRPATMQKAVVVGQACGGLVPIVYEDNESIFRVTCGRLFEHPDEAVVGCIAHIKEVCGHLQEYASLVEGLVN